MAGLGITTLARKVYNTPSIVNYFDVKIWCAASQAYNRRTLLVEIIKKATNNKIKIKEYDDRADMLRRALIGKRCLIMLDDIWDIKAWENLGICFPEGKYGSRVMVTTEIEQVAKHLQHHVDPYSLSFLTSKESWKLLEIIAKMGRKASLWLEVGNDFSSLALGEKSIKVIQSSYDYLEDHLKPCLLYMGLFPEDHKIPFVLNAGTENMEEASRVYLSNLHNKRLVMIFEMRINCDVEYCSLHDVVRELCLRKHTDHFYYQLDKIQVLDFKETNSLEFIAHPKLNKWNILYSHHLDLVVNLRFIWELHLMDVELPNSWATAMQSLTQLR
ncbi:hypothetical protein R3W88_026977 [Solanum pinnatisectum]|uniref:NB-ARC domain-containing protein n=1 Tax=Solanum pinnatisectum TaxID=50273 RepID=A0AAV9LG04_9SOLN|nr:hypothetical protein R3W88_026977 [Solanum pinnatisectum]